MSVKIVISKPCRLSYPALFEPRAPRQGGGDPRYQATILIPKTDTETIQMLQTGYSQEMAAAAAPTGAWKGAAPQQPAITLYDGDGTQPRSGEPWGPECKGHWVLRTSSTSKPDVVDEFGNKAMDATKFYAGCYCYFSINLAAYSGPNGKGVGAFLNCVMWAQDGEPLEAHASAKDDFASILAARANQIPGNPAASTGFAATPVMPSPVAPAQQPPMGFGGFQIQ